MAGRSLNRVILLGKLVATKDIATIARGSTEMYINTILIENNGGQGDKTYIKIIAYGNIAQTFSKYTSKGDLVCVEGKLLNHKYKSNATNKEYLDTYVCVDNLYLIPRQQRSTEIIQEQEKTSNNVGEFIKETYEQD